MNMTGSGLAYSTDGGKTWLKGFNAQGPKDSEGNNVALTGRFVTPTQSGLATDGEYIYYTTSVFYSWYEGLDNRREAWSHRIDPEEMFNRDYSPVNIVQPITKSGFSNVSTMYLGDNKIGRTLGRGQNLEAYQTDSQYFLYGAGYTGFQAHSRSGLGWQGFRLLSCLEWFAPSAQSGNSGRR